MCMRKIPPERFYYIQHRISIHLLLRASDSEVAFVAESSEEGRIMTIHSDK